jgi:type IX secretion system PorP/SprF family membrane protein
MTGLRKIYIAFVVALSLGCVTANAQEIEHTQYYLNLPGVNPAFTGIEEYVDTRVSYRQGWNDFAVKNNYSFVSAYGPLGNIRRAALTNNSLRLSDPTAYSDTQVKKKLLRKHGVGGMIANRNFGPYTSTAVSINYAYHLPVSRTVMMSFGTKMGYAAQRLSLNNLTVRDDVNDLFYQQLINSNQGNSGNYFMDFGYALYSSKFYFGVSASNLVSSRVSGSGLLDIRQTTWYRAQASLLSAKLGKDFHFSPGVQVIYGKNYDLIWGVNARLRYKDILYAGGGYTVATPKLSMMFGVRVTPRLSLNYSHDKYLSDLNNFSVSVNELVLGLVLVNKFNLKSITW